MKKIKLTLLTIFISFSIFEAQINVDSLIYELNKYDSIVSDFDFMRKVRKIKYINNDSLVQFEINYTEDGTVKPDKKDFSIKAYRYENYNKDIQIRTYDHEGNLKFTEKPPIIKMKYDKNNNVIFEDYFISENKRAYRVESDFDENNNVTEKRILNEHLKIETKKIYKYEENGTVVKVMNVDGKDSLILDKMDVSIYYTKYLTSKREKISEERFYDHKGELATIHDPFYCNCSYSIVKYIHEPGEEFPKALFYNSKNIRVATVDWNNDKY